MSEPKLISADEFRDVGYLQEVNRRFLHPLGLEMTVTPNDRGIHHFDGIRDFRDSAGGVSYSPEQLDRAKFLRIETFLVERSTGNTANPGFGLQPIPTSETAAASPTEQRPS